MTKCSYCGLELEQGIICEEIDPCIYRHRVRVRQLKITRIINELMKKMKIESLKDACEIYQTMKGEG